MVVAVVFVLAVAPIPEAGPEGSDKLEHFAAFITLGIGAALVYPRQPIWLSAGLVIGYGGLIELVQALPIVHRDCSLFDWIADVVGVAAGVAVMALSGLRARFWADRPLR